MDGRTIASTASLIAGLALLGCQPSTRIATAAAARVGCSDPDVVFSDVEKTGTRRDWAMQCRGETWRCNGTSEADASCERTDGVAARRTAGAAGGGGALEWAAYDSPSCGVSVEFPGAPLRQTSEVRVQGGTSAIETATFEPSGVDAMMAATCTTISPAHEGIVALLDLTRNSVLAGAGARLLDERPSIGGRELRFAVRDREALARFVVVGDRLLSLIVAPVDAFPGQGARRFLDSPRSLPGADESVVSATEGSSPAPSYGHAGP
jgi:hypothetical protein